MHIGSQITDLDPFRNAFALLKELVERLRQEGFAIDFVNLGGGVGIPYRNDQQPQPSPTDSAKLVTQAIYVLNAREIFETVRISASKARILCSFVIQVMLL